MKKGLCISLSVLSVFSLSTLAQARPYTIIPTSSSHAYVDLGLGQALTYRADSGSVIVPGGPSLSLQPKNSGLPQSLSIGGGWLWPQMYRAESPYFPFVSLGLYYQHTNLFDTKKPVELHELVHSIHFDQPANYVFSQDGLMANLKMDIYRWKYMMPYLGVSLGASWNQIKEKQPLLLAIDPSVTVPFTTEDQRTTSFSYSLGAGLDFPVTEKLWFSLGYSYSNFGRVQAGDICLPTSPTPPSNVVCTHNGFGNLDHFGNLTTQTILLTGRYVFA